MILLCYDGSEDAKAAIESAARLFQAEPVQVLTVWEPFVEMLDHGPAGFGMMAGIPDVGKLDEASHQSAVETAEQGAAIARDRGLDATAEVHVQSGAIAQTIMDAAERAGADAIVLGSRGRTGLKSLLLGSVSHAVVQSADRPVLTVPSPIVARERTEKRHERTGIDG